MIKRNLKKLAPVILSITTICTLFAGNCLVKERTFGAENEIKYGDVNGDKEINVTDGVLLKKHLAGINVIFDEKASDVNADGKVDITDAVLLMKHLAGMDVVFGSQVAKPTDTIEIMCDTTVIPMYNGDEKFLRYLKELTGLNIQLIEPDPSTYYDIVDDAFRSNNPPDVILLSPEYYAYYAQKGLLWNMTDAWENSDLKKSGRMIEEANDVFSALKVKGADGTKGLYGFSPVRGNGCCTYIKKSWLDAAGISVDEVKNTTMDWDTYYSYLKRMAEVKKGYYVISAPDFVSENPPYTQYLPEFYQQAHFSFYQNESGQYVDGFTEKAMQEALQRIHTAVKNGVLDAGTLGQKASDARNKFLSIDEFSTSCVLTYWSGMWADTLKQNLEAKDMDGELIAINPIKELGTYTDRIAPVWCITSAAENPEGIFKYLIETMLDGGDIQTAWEYGAKGTHWDTKAESVTLAGNRYDVKTYEEGEFHFLPSPRNPKIWSSKYIIDPFLVLAKFDGASDPGIDKLGGTIAKENAEWFTTVSKVDRLVSRTDTINLNIDDINIKRREVVSKVAFGEWSVEEGMENYKLKVGAKVEDCLKSLNDL